MSENNKGYKYKELFSDEASKAKANIIQGLKSCHSLECEYNLYSLIWRR